MDAQIPVMLGCIVLLGLGAWISILNWAVFWQVCVRKQSTSSWVPLLGAVLVSLGLAWWPFADLRGAWWVPFIVDWGSAPGIVYTCLWIWHRRRS